MSPEFSTKGHKVQNNETGSIIEIPLPGAGKDDVSISVKESDKLIVEVNKDTKYSGGQIYKFKLLPESDTEGIEAEIKNGLLVLNVPKKKSFQN
jgi:HSP20 family molecular chaperone IbpA